MEGNRPIDDRQPFDGFRVGFYGGVRQRAFAVARLDHAGATLGVVGDHEEAVVLVVGDREVADAQPLQHVRHGVAVADDQHGPSGVLVEDP